MAERAPGVMVELFEAFLHVTPKVPEFLGGSAGVDVDLPVEVVEAPVGPESHQGHRRERFSSAEVGVTKP